MQSVAPLINGADRRVQPVVDSRGLGPRTIDLVLYAGIGGKLIGIAVVGGVIATVGALLERSRR
jgi:hypothetical protein